MKPERFKPSSFRPICAAAALCLSLALAAPAAADSREELRSAGAVTAAWTVSTSLMVAVAAIPIVKCDRDLACLGTALLSVGGFVLTHPFVASASVHLLTDAVGDRQPYWHSLLGQTVGDTLAVGALLTAVALAPSPRPDRPQTALRALVFTSCALLSLAGPLLVRPWLDQADPGPSGMTQLSLTF